ncbi:MAG: CoA-binding protein [Gloeobacteraceae cyanobacterium ES-bin-316]|nr:CoA-binding protein [Ferruginibacter sp.]
MRKITLVLGASENPQRYSYLAIRKLTDQGHTVVAIGKKEAKVNDVQIVTNMPSIPGIHTVTLYLNAQNQKPYYDYILDLNPERIIFNPGAENPELILLAREKDIPTLEACTLVMLSTNQY